MPPLSLPYTVPTLCDSVYMWWKSLRGNFLTGQIHRDLHTCLAMHPDGPSVLLSCPITTHWLAQCNVSLCSCGALWECSELCDFLFCPYVHVRHSLCCVVICAPRQTHSHVCVCMHTQLYNECMRATFSKMVVCVHPTPLHKGTAIYVQRTTSHCQLLYTYSTPQHLVRSYKLLAVSCIDHVSPNAQDGRTPLMLAAGFGHLPVARLLVEEYHCDVLEEDGKVSGWEVKGGVSEYSAYVSSHMWPSDTGS